MRKATIFTFFLFTLLLGCKQNKHQIEYEPTAVITDSILIISPNYPEQDTTPTINMIADSLFYIALQKKITHILQVEYSENFIWVLSTEAIHVFTSTGKLLYELPVKMGSFSILPELSRFYTYTFMDRILRCYNFQGEIIWQTFIKHDSAGFYGQFFTALNDSLFAISNINMGNNTDELIFVNHKGHVIHQKINQELFSVPSSIYSSNKSWRRSLFHACNGARYHRLYDDTLFCIKSTKLIPIAIEQKISKVPLKHRSEYTGQRPDEFFKYCKKENKYATRFYDTPRYLITEYLNGAMQIDIPNFLVYDKKNETLNRTNHNLVQSMENKNLHFGFLNDYDGGLAFGLPFNQIII